MSKLQPPMSALCGLVAALGFALASLPAAAQTAPEVAAAPQAATKQAATSNESPPQLDNSLNNQTRPREPALRSRDREAR